MERLEKVREYVDDILIQMTDTIGQRHRCYMHMYGVSQACAMIALKRGEDAELAAIAGMLHDIYPYVFLDRQDHAHKGAVLARDILYQLAIFSRPEIDRICHAIDHHSEKGAVHSSFDDILIDADVMQHCLYEPLSEPLAQEKTRWEALKDEFGLY